MTMPPDVAVTGLTELAVRARTDAGLVNKAPPVPGRSLLQILRANVLTRFNAILGALFAVVLVVGPAAGRAVRRRAGDQHWHRGGPGTAGQARARPPAWWPWCPRDWCCSPPSRSPRARCGWPGTGSWCRNWRRSRAWPAPFSSARKWSGASFDGHGTWLLGAPSVVARGGLPGDAAAVRYLLDQGITIKVLSGDAPRAVAAIAGRAGIPAGGRPAIAVAAGTAGITYPFFPRHLTIISTLTIGVPGFFLALAPGAPRARPGFTRRVLAFTVPAGTATRRRGAGRVRRPASRHSGGQADPGSATAAGPGPRRLRRRGAGRRRRAHHVAALARAGAAAQVT
jgi:hypothetical protein